MIKMVHYRLPLLLILILTFTYIAYSQKTDSVKVPGYLGGSVTINTKGISSIPNLTLGKPAALFFMSAGRKIRFEPEFRFALEGKPWLFILWWRYDMMNNEKFLIRMRVNYGLNFRTIPVTTDSAANEILGVSRSLTGDVTASFILTKHFSIGT
jgi:hypothetical protein